MTLTELSIKQPVATMMLFMAVVLIGIFSFLRLNLDLYPEIEPPAISVITIWPGASASDVETEVTEEIEARLNTVNNLDTLRSRSLDNLSIVSCLFEFGSDLDAASNDIRDMLDQAKMRLPDDAESPMLFKFSSATTPILFMSFTADKSYPRLFHIIDKEVGDELKRVQGVGGLIIHGGLRRQINIYFDIKKIEGFHLSLYRINQVMAAENLNIPAGIIKYGKKDFFVRVPARYKTIEDIRNTVIGTFNNKPVYLRDVANVEDDYKTLQMYAYGNGKPGLVMMLQKQSGTNTVEVIERVKKRLNEISKNLPSDIKLDITTDASEDIIKSVKNLRDTLWVGLFLVVVVTVAFLRQIRTAFIIVIIIPFAMITAFILIYAINYTLNMVTLMALAVASGMVVDDGIVVIENIVRHIERGRKIKTAATLGANEMWLAITTSTMTTVVVFIPLMFATGIAGIIFKPLAFVVTITLLSSLMIAIMLTPMMASKLLLPTSEMDKRRKGVLKVFYDYTEKGFLFVENAYKNLLAWSLQHRKTVIFLTLSVFISSLSFIPFVSTSFFPDRDTGNASIRFRLEEGTRIEETKKMIEGLLADINKMVDPKELKHYAGWIGQTDAGVASALGFDEGPNTGSFQIKLVDKEERKTSILEVSKILREKFSSIPGIVQLQVATQSPIELALRGGRRPISLEIQGHDIETNLAVAGRIKKILEGISGLEDVAISQKNPRPELWVEVDRRKATDMGLNVLGIAGTLRNYFYGVDATEYKDSGESFDIVTRFTEDDKNKLYNLENAPLFTPDGRMIRLNNAAAVKEGLGPIEIERKNRQRIITVGADLYKRSLGDASNDIMKELNNFEKPPGVNIEFGGEVEDQREAFQDLTLMLILGIIMVYMIMASLFGGLRDPFIVMFSIPFAFSGVIYAYVITGATLGLLSFMGVIMLMGIVVKNAIILVDYIHLLQKRGLVLIEAITEAGRCRLRPVLMTTLTTIFGLLPVAISNKSGSEAWKGLGITMLGGLSVSTLITLILIPTIFYMFEKRKIAKIAEKQQAGIDMESD